MFQNSRKIMFDRKHRSTIKICYVYLLLYCYVNLLCREYTVYGYVWIAYGVNDLHVFVGTYAVFCWNFHDYFALIWLNVIDISLNFLLQNMGGRVLVGIKNMIPKKTQRKRSNGVKPHNLNDYFWLPKREITHTLNELLLYNENALFFRVARHFL